MEHGWPSVEAADMPITVCEELALDCPPCGCTSFECYHTARPVCREHLAYLNGLMQAVWYLIPHEEGDQQAEYELMRLTIDPWLWKEPPLATHTEGTAQAHTHEDGGQP